MITINKNNYNNDIPLISKWLFYDHIKCEQTDYEQSTNIIGKCSTVFEFWTCYNNIPKPSQFFFKRETGKPYYIKDSKKREISSVSVFKDNIQPKWEDPINKNGGSIEYRLKLDVNIDFLDKFWLYLCMHCMSEQISDKITGFRIVDSSVIVQNKPLYRVELWYSDVNSSKIIENKFRKIFDISQDQKIIVKKHT